MMPLAASSLRTPSAAAKSLAWRAAALAAIRSVTCRQWQHGEATPGQQQQLQQAKHGTAAACLVTAAQILTAQTPAGAPGPCLDTINLEGSLCTSPQHGGCADRSRLHYRNQALPVTLTAAYPPLRTSCSVICARASASALSSSSAVCRLGADNPSSSSATSRP